MIENDIQATFLLIKELNDEFNLPIKSRKEREHTDQLEAKYGKEVTHEIWALAWAQFDQWLKS